MQTKDPQLDTRLLRERLKLIAYPAVAVPIPTLLAALFIVVLAKAFVPHQMAWVWFFALAAVVAARWYFCRRIRPETEAQPQTRLNQIVAFGLAVGVVSGSSAWLMFSALPFDRQLILTLILVSWTAGGVAANGGYPRVFYWLIGPMQLPIVFCWSFLSDHELSPWIASLSAVLVVFQILMVRYNAKLVSEAILIRYENQALLEALRAEQALTLNALAAAEAANAAKLRFLAAASHDLRQPVHALSMTSATLALVATDPRTKKIAEHIDQSVRSVSELLSGLLDISKLDAGLVRAEESAVDLTKLAARLHRDFDSKANAKAIELSVQLPALTVTADAVLLYRVLANLTDNAIKYTASGEVKLSAVIQDNTLQIDVQDSGIGIEKAQQAKVFEEFYQIGNDGRDRGRGLGLGLSIVNRIAALAGYTISLESALGTGTRFRLTLPLKQLGTEALAAGAVAQAASGEGDPVRRIIFLDDDNAVRASVSELLRVWGHSCDAFDSASSAVASIRSASIAPDLIISDLRLGNGADGIAAIAMIRDVVGQVPAFVVSGDIDPQELARVQQAGRHMLHNPLSAQRLRSEINQASPEK